MQSHVPLVAVISDDPLSQKLFCQNLLVRNYAVANLTSAGEVEALLAEGYPVGLLVLDITTPAPIGFGKCLALRDLTTAPIIVLSTGARERDKKLAIKLGASAYLAKPFSMQSLIHEVQRLLQQPAIGIFSEKLAAVG